MVVYDPLVGVDGLRAALPSDGVEIASSLAEAIGDVEACVVTTLAPEFDELERLLRERNGTRPLIVDGRRGIAPAGFSEHGYVGVGRAGSWS